MPFLRQTPVSVLILLLPAAALSAPPNAPTGLLGSAPGYNEVKLEWTDNSTDEFGFEILYRVGTTGNFNSLGITVANETSITLDGTTANTTYQFQVRAASVATEANPREYSAVAGPVTILTPYAVTSNALPGAAVGQPFELNLTTSRAAAISSYSISALPAGLSIDSATGKITGTPTAKETVTATAGITFTDGAKAAVTTVIRVLKGLPGTLPPVAVTPPPTQPLTMGSPTLLSLGTVFSDPDVSSAARLTTDLGNLDFVFFPGSAPQTVTNFLGYLNRGDFVNTMFHRSVPGFIVQAGAFRADATASKVTTQPPVVNEPDITNARGTVAMAKIGGDPDSATNQFFVNLADNAFNLNGQNEGFTVFARVAGNGMAVADAIAALPTKSYASVNGALTDTPVRAATPPAVYDPSLLVRISTASVIPPLSFSATSANPAITGAAVTGTDLTLTPAAPGQTTVTVTATDLDNLTVNSEIPVTVTDSYESWSARQNFPTPAEASASADPDGDGLLNLVEYALGSAPLTQASAEMAPGLSGGSPTLTFTLRRFTSGVTVTLQTASDVAGPWTDQWKNSDGLTHAWISSSSTGEALITVSAKDPAPLPATAGRAFWRLKVSQ